jgi:hypothetical protein
VTVVSNSDEEAEAESESESEAEAEVEAPEAVQFWWKQKRLKICHFRFHSVSKFLIEFWNIFAN